MTSLWDTLTKNMNGGVAYANRIKIHEEKF